RYPEDSEASVFYALVLDVTALPSDKTFANQLKAAAILEKVSAAQPDHPGVAHYLIHSYDYPPIAAQGLPAARRYASVAPSAAHALHMPGSSPGAGCGTSRSRRILVLWRHQRTISTACTPWTIWSTHTCS